VPPTLRTVLAGLLALAALGVAAALILGAIERKLVFPAPSVDRAWLSAQAERTGAVELDLRAADGTALYGQALSRDPAVARRGLVLYFSGNGSTVGASPGRYQRFTDAGFDVVHVNYRGYPGSDGSPTQAGLIMDAHAAWDEARRRSPAEDIVVYGKSLGGGVAIGLVASLSEQPRGLVVESSFSRLVDVAAETLPWAPVRLVLRNRFDSLDRASQISCPTLILHGTADTLIGVHHAHRLAAALTGSQLVKVAGAGHNDDLLTDGAAWQAFLALFDTPTEHR